jgi:hypothetical protein
MNYKIFFYVIASSYLIVSNFSCREKSTEPEIEEVGVLMPLKIGNSWSYGTGDYTPGDTATYAYSAEINRSITIRDTTYYELKGISNGDILDLVKNTDEGLFLYKYYQSTGKILCILFFKYPIETGVTYNFFSQAYGECNIEITKQLVDVYAGQFECYVYIVQYWQRAPAYYYCPNIGQIAYESTWGETYLQLVTYNLK